MKRIEINMTNNDVLKKLRIALNLKDTDILETLKLSGFEISKTELNAFFRKPDHRNYKECGDQVLRRFLDGLIIKMRGPREKRKVRIVTRSKPYQGKSGKAPTKPD
jgi:uncharacterized protein YehS (DUF1456 family)